MWFVSDVQEGTVTDMSSSDALASAATLTTTSTSSEKTSNRVARTAGGSNHLAGRTAVNRSNTTSGGEGGLVMVASSLATPSSRANPAEPFSNVRLHLCFCFSLTPEIVTRGRVSRKLQDLCVPTTDEIIFARVEGHATQKKQQLISQYRSVIRLTSYGGAILRDRSC